MKSLFYTLLIIFIFPLCPASNAQVSRRDTKKSVPYRANYNRLSKGAGGLHSFEIRNGKLWGWGRNNRGQIGDGTSLQRDSPVQIGNDSTWVGISTGAMYTLGIKADGTLWAWGGNAEGELGDGTTNDSNIPIQIGSDNTWICSASIKTTSYGIKSNGTLWAWGENINGSIGDGALSNRLSPVQIGSDTKWQTVFPGSEFCHGLKSDGTLWGWGKNNTGELGDGTTTQRNSPVQIGTDQDWVIASSGNFHTIALKSDGTLWSWGGDNNFGELGIGNAKNTSFSPMQIGTEKTWVSLSAGLHQSHALKSDGTLWTWGRNGYGELGDGSNTDRINPIQVGTDNKWIQVFGANYHTKALKSDGTTWAWGDNGYGNFGDGTTTSSNTPQLVNTPPDEWLAISSGFYHNLALKSNGTIWSWGGNVAGELGDGTNTQKNSPIQIGSDTDWISISAGNDHSLGLKIDGSLWAWGSNYDGQLGDGTAIEKNSPIRIGTDNDWVSILASQIHSVALKSDGTLWAWGSGGQGRIGDGTTDNKYVPTKVNNENDWVAIAAGSNTMALKSNGTLWSWGRNDVGQVGVGTNLDILTPTQVGTGNNWICIEGSMIHSTGLKCDGTLWAWGGNGNGRLGNGTLNDENSPIQIGTSDTWIGVSAGSFHSFGIRSNGEIYSWGSNSDGQLADGTNADRLTPTKIGTVNNWVLISSGGKHTSGLKSQRNKFCSSGDNEFGQVGDGSNDDTNTFTCNTEQCSAPSPPSSSNQTICYGQAATLSATGSGTLSWYDAFSNGNKLGSGNSFTTPILRNDTTFYVQDSTCFVSTSRTAVKVTLSSLPLVSANSSSLAVCLGDTVTLFGSGATTYAWSNAVIDSVAFAPTATSTYTLSGTDSNNCSSSDTITIRVNALPMVAANTNLTIICLGDSIRLSGSGGNLYTWTPSVNNGEYFYPSSTHTYTLTGTDSNNCSNTDSIRIIVNNLPNVLANASADTICAGASLILFGLGAESYSWTDGVTDSLSFQPTSSQTYTVTGTDSNSCSNTDSIYIHVNPSASKPVFAIANSSILCEGDSLILTGSGASVYSWSNGIVDGVAFAPNATKTYTLTGTDTNNCTNTDTISIQVNALPVVFANASATAVCDNDSVLLYGSGASFYAWTGGVNDSLYFIPTATSNYTVTGTDANNCSSWDSISILKSNSTGLVVTATASANTICQGDSVRLKGSGADSYSWSGGIMDGIHFSPAITTSYTLTGSNANGCSGTTTNTIIVKPAPAVAAHASLNTICVGDSVWVFGEGANTYTWTNAILDTVKFAPAQTEMYTLTGTNSDNCSAMDSIQITVYSLPLLGVSASVSDSLVCSGDTVILSGSGASNYYWTGSVKNREPFNPTRSATYTLTGITENTCDNRTSITININPLPILTPLARPSSAAICIGASVTLTGAGAETYVWSDSVMDGEAFFPTSTKTYTLTGTDTNRCINSVIRVVSVFPLPEVSISGNPDTAICLGDSVTLWARGALTYIWSDNVIDSVAFFPDFTKTYTVIGKDNYACSNTASVLIEVDSCKEEVIIIGIKESGINANEIKIYPNPSNGAFTIALSEIQGKQIQSGSYKILNELGQTIQEFKLNSSTNYSIHIENLNSGIYFIVGGSGNEIIRQKIVVLK